MTPEEFVSRCMASPAPPYVRWGSDWVPGFDCYGCIILYWREVHGMELLPEPATASGMADGFSALGKHWREVTQTPGACAFMAWDGNIPRHCGVMLPDGSLLHTEAPSLVSAGGPRVTPYRAIERLYGDARYYAPKQEAFACHRS